MITAKPSLQPKQQKVSLPNISTSGWLEETFRFFHKQDLMRLAIALGKTKDLKGKTEIERYVMIAKTIPLAVMKRLNSNEDIRNKQLEVLCLIALVASFTNSKFIYANDVRKTQNRLFRQ